MKRLILMIALLMICSSVGCSLTSMVSRGFGTGIPELTEPPVLDQ